MINVQFKLPESNEYLYIYSNQTGHYHLSAAPMAEKKLPERIKVEKTQLESIKSPYIIRGWKDKWSDTILTGIIPLSESKTESWFYGNQKIGNNKSYLLFEFSSDKTTIRVLRFNNFYPIKKDVFNSVYLASIVTK